MKAKLAISKRERDEKIKRKKALTEQLSKNESSEQRIKERTRIEDLTENQEKSLKENKEQTKRTQRRFLCDVVKRFNGINR